MILRYQFNGLLGYSYFEAAADLSGECESFRLRLRIEYTRLLDWADVAGLSDEINYESFDGNMRMNRAVVMALLGEISALLTTMRHSCLQNTEEVLNEAQEIKEPVAEFDLQSFQLTFEASNLPYRQRRHRKGLNHVLKIKKGLQNIVSEPKRRMKWAIRDREKFITDLSRLRELTNYLHETVGEHKVDILLQTANETQLAMVQLTDTVDEMKSLLQAIKDSTPADADDVASLRSETSTIVTGDPVSLGPLPMLDIDTLVFQLTSFRINSLDVKKQADAGNLAHLRLDAAKFQDTKSAYDSFGNKVLANFGGQRVWVEWKKVSIGVVEDHRGLPTSGILFEENIQYLTALLSQKHIPEAFRVPQCLGYFLEKQSSSVGMVFRYPQTAPPSSQPVTLLRLLGNTAPPLLSKISMAKRLTSSLLYLHSVNWLHKSLNSTSVLFFQSGNNFSWSDLYISSFEHARPDEGRTLSGPAQAPGLSQLYWHPDYMSTSGHIFRKSYDIYSIGIVLIEIALWQPASRIFNVVDPTMINKATLEGVRASILGENSCLENVRSVMGNRYHDAAKTCIEGVHRFKLDSRKEVEADPVVGAMIQQEFLRLVVDVLDSVVV